jgi:ribosomal-protein-alanine N-acetyltransferase
MEMMPYHPGLVTGHEPASAHGTFDEAAGWTPLPTFGERATDWTDGLPALGDGTFTLRELRLDDAPSLFAHLTTEEVARFISPPPTSVEGFEAFIRWTHTRRAQGKYACFGIVPAGETHAVGMFQIKVLDAANGLAEWGFVLGQAYWGTGLFLKGARRVVDFVFGHMGIARLEARSVLQNGRGNGALRKVGAVRTGVLPRSFERAGVQLDQALWIIDRDVWWAALADWGATIH